MQLGEEGVGERCRDIMLWYDLYVRCMVIPTAEIYSNANYTDTMCMCGIHLSLQFINHPGICFHFKLLIEKYMN